MASLNPTLWRTCKMLAGPTRIKLLRQIQTHPESGVTALGRRVGIGHAAASQELRRIQSRGLLQADRRGATLVYRFAPDSQVPSAAPLLKSILAALSRLPPENDLDMCRIAAGLAHERRIRIVRTLMEKPRARSELPFLVHVTGHPLHAHLKTLEASGWVVLTSRQARFTAPDHPLAKTLTDLLRQDGIR